MMGSGALAIVMVLPSLWLHRWWRRRRFEADSALAQLNTLPEVVVAISLGVRSGLSVRASVELAAEVIVSPAALALETELARGGLTADMLDRFGRRVGPEASALVASLVSSLRYGSPVVESLDRMEFELRSMQRRRAEAEARRLPVRMLFPLVLCALPALLIVAVVPVVVVALRPFA